MGKPEKCIAPTAIHGMGHNRPPASFAHGVYHAMERMRSAVVVEPFQCGAPWTGHASDKELRRLAKLEKRINLRKQTIAEATAERKLIMNRCIKRMRRGEGKN